MLLVLIQKEKGAQHPGWLGGQAERMREGKPHKQGGLSAFQLSAASVPLRAGFLPSPPAGGT
jgi:hypothetical protein